MDFKIRIGPGEINLKRLQGEIKSPIEVQSDISHQQPLLLEWEPILYSPPKEKDRKVLAMMKLQENKKASCMRKL